MMDLREELLVAHSKAQAERICAYIGNDAEKFAELMKLLTGPVYRLSQRAARPVSICIERHPGLIKPYWSLLTRLVERDDTQVAVRRNVVRLLQFVEIPRRYQGRIFEACYALLADVAEPVAVRVFAMTVAAQIARNEPELLAELRVVAMKHPEKATAGFRSRRRRLFGS